LENLSTPSIFSGEQALLNSKLLFLMVENIEIATFSKNAKQFMQCTTVIDKTTELKCKVGNI